MQTQCQAMCQLTDPRWNEVSKDDTEKFVEAKLNLHTALHSEII